MAGVEYLETGRRGSRVCLRPIWATSVTKQVICPLFSTKENISEAAASAAVGSPSPGRRWRRLRTESERVSLFLFATVFPKLMGWGLFFKPTWPVAWNHSNQGLRDLHG